MGNTRIDQEFVNNTIKAFCVMDDDFLSKDVDKYLIILNRNNKDERLWKDVYCDYYKINGSGRTQEFRDNYFDYLKKHNGDDLRFEDVFNYVNSISDRREFAFTTALMNTINEKNPILMDL